MKKKVLVNLGMILCAASLFSGCGSNDNNAAAESSAIESGIEGGIEGSIDSAAETAGNVAATEATGTLDATEASAASEVTEGVQLPDGIYTADFNTDSTMFHVNDALDGKGTLTVKDGKMTIHISLVSKKIVNLYLGLAEDAEKEGAELLEPTEDTVTYSDGTTETVYGFDVPVAVLDDEFDLAILGTKGTWYDHKVIVTEPVAADENVSSTENTGSMSDIALEDGTYSIELDFEGGSGKAKILSPASITVENGNVTATVQWSSSNYDYMLVNGEKYLPISTDGGSVFEIPVTVFDEPMDVVGDTVAMSTPHEIEYTITFHSDTM